MPERPFLTAQWRYLAMLQYEVEPDVLRPLVPRGTELDQFAGRTLVSMVGFRFLETRVLGVAIPFHRRFDEVNLRFYVRRRGPEGWRRAVVFIREIVPRQAIALVARFCYNEPYIALPMRHSIDIERAEKGEKGRVRYEWLQGQWAHLEVETEGSPTSPAPGSEQEFVSEHYWGYTAQRDGSCLEYHVAHIPWRVWAVRRASLHCDIERLYGASFDRFFGAGPCSAFLADGSEVAVYRGRRLPYNEGLGVDANTEALLRRCYAAFNARDLESAVATMHPDVTWPNGWEGGWIEGRQGVREYWQRQWAAIDPRVEPVAFTHGADGRITVSVHQVVRDSSGKLLADRMVQHVYELQDGYVRRMEIRDESVRQRWRSE
jgi:uncharacterized protein YqjF (DUF2071 family)/ketosteroid isomerase-like protein